MSLNQMYKNNKYVFKMAAIHHVTAWLYLFDQFVKTIEKQSIYEFDKTDIVYCILYSNNNITNKKATNGYNSVF